MDECQPLPSLSFNPILSSGMPVRKHFIAMTPVQGLILVHFSAQRERFCGLQRPAFSLT